MNTRKAVEHEMNNAFEQQLEGNWKQFSGKVQEAWGVLTEDDVDKAEGRIDQLIGAIQEKTGETRESVARKLRSLADSATS